MMQTNKLYKLVNDIKLSDCELSNFISLSTEFSRHDAHFDVKISSNIAKIWLKNCDIYSCTNYCRTKNISLRKCKKSCKNEKKMKCWICSCYVCLMKRKWSNCQKSWMKKCTCCLSQRKMKKIIDVYDLKKTMFFE